MANVLSVGVIGVGGIARAHLGSIAANDNIRLAAVMDVDPRRAEEVAKEYDARPHTSLDAFLNDPEIQGVHICSPHKYHGEQAVAAANAGKHVLVEKPMALSVAECDRMIQASDRAGKVLMVGQVMRQYPVNRKVRELIVEGAIGKVGHTMRRRYSYFDPGEPGNRYPGWYRNVEIGGNCVLYGFGSHEYDIIAWYLNSPVVEVYAKGSESTELYRGQKDTYSALLTHENGAVSLISQTVVSHTGGGDQYIIGSEGSMFLTSGKLVLNGQEVPVEGSPDAGMRTQVYEFADCCLYGRTPDAHGRSVRQTMAAIEAAMLSAERNAAVRVDEFGECP